MGVRRSILLILAAAVLLGLAGRQHPRLLRLRADYPLGQAQPLENAPPLVALTTVALGGFRGILADLLWIRSTRLQEEGRYFELVQLATWITRLEPRFTEAWAFHAWNLAYNISVLFRDPADRWRWVQHGIRLLRDEGLRWNPTNPRLHRELGWLFQHKLGSSTDQAHLVYKQAWAREMQTLFDGPSPDLAHLSPDRRRRMVEDYRLDPDLVQRVEREYGPLDWRLPQAQAIYWASRGRTWAVGFEAQAADRMIQQSLVEAFRQGRLVMDEAEGVFHLSPNLDLLPRVLQIYEKALADHPDDESIGASYRAAVEELVLFLFLYGRTGEARQRFEDLQRRFPSDETAVGFEDFVFHAYTSELEDLSEPRILALVESAAYQGFFWQALGDEERAAGYDQLARLIWQRYMDRRADPDWRARTGLPPMEEIRRRAREQVLQDLKSERSRARLARTPVSPSGGSAPSP